MATPDVDVTASSRVPRFRLPPLPSMILFTGILLIILFTLLNVGLSKFLQYLVLGLPYGGIIALIAMGYSMVYGIILLINFAHGEIFMLGAFLTMLLVLPLDPAGTDARLASAVGPFAILAGGAAAVAAWTLLDKIRSAGLRAGASVIIGVGAAMLLRWGGPAAVPFFVALPIAMILTAGFGIAMDTLAYKPLRDAPRLVPLITAIGVSLLLQNLAQFLFGTKDYRFPRNSLPEFLTIYIPKAGGPSPMNLSFWDALTKTRTVVIHYFDLRFPLVDAVIFTVAVVTMLVTTAFIQHTRTGKAMRACALDKNTARLVGIDVNRTVALTFATGAALAALGAPFYVIKYGSVRPDMGTVVGILAFSSAVLGGIGNIKGAMLGGFAIGIIYNFVPIYESTAAWPFFKWLASMEMFSKVENWNLFRGISQWQNGIAYIFMILVMVFRPQGLLGTPAARRA